MFGQAGYEKQKAADSAMGAMGLRNSFVYVIRECRAPFFWIDLLANSHTSWLLRSVSQRAVCQCVCAAVVHMHRYNERVLLQNAQSLAALVRSRV